MSRCRGGLGVGRVCPGTVPLPEHFLISMLKMVHFGGILAVGFKIQRIQANTTQTREANMSLLYFT